MFPSPIGELHFSIAVHLSGAASKTVSVPYRGATFLNQYQKYPLRGCIPIVSVPYRGATFLNLS